MSKKNKKKNKKKSFKMTPLKSFLSIAFVVILVVGVVSLISYINRDKYYVCTKYEMVTKTPVNGEMTDFVEDLLPDFEYYKFILNEDGKTFTLKFKLDKKDAKEQTEKGKYTIKEVDGVQELQLEYNDYDETEPSVVKYTIKDDKLTRSQPVYVTDALRGTVKQTFVLK